MNETHIVIQLVGYHYVGKSTTLFSYIHNYFKEILTIGPECEKKIIKLNDQIISLLLCDFFFNEMYIPIEYAFHNKPHGLLVIFDITNRKTFDHARSFIDSLKQIKVRNSFYLILFGNKLDLENEREISKEEAQKFANEHRIKYFEASAKTLEGLNNVFNDLVTNIYNKVICDEDNKSKKCQIFAIEEENEGKKCFCW